MTDKYDVLFMRGNKLVCVVKENISMDGAIKIRDVLNDGLQDKAKQKGFHYKTTTSPKQKTMKKKKFFVACYIRVDPDEPTYHDSKEDAEKEIEHLSLMQPENHYEIEEVEV